MGHAKPAKGYDGRHSPLPILRRNSICTFLGMPIIRQAIVPAERDEVVSIFRVRAQPIRQP